jgi:hypothetical protein
MPLKKRIVAAIVISSVIVAVGVFLMFYFFVIKRKSTTANTATPANTNAVEPTYVSAVLMGGLGNQLFQMAAAFGVAHATGRKLVIHAPSIQKSTLTHTTEKYTDTVFKSWDQVHFAVDAMHNENGKECFTYNPIPLFTANHLQLHGYFQNEQYFKHCWSAFASKLHLPRKLEILHNTCFIHMRFGDYLGHNLHFLDLITYYLPRALQLQRSKTPGVQFMVFSNDTDHCKTVQLLQSHDIHFSTETNEVQTLMQMSQCWIGGICSNSSYAWWGAYLNPNPKRIVTFPKQWVNDMDWPVRIQFEGSHLLPHEQ